jgi:hypothetical protein
MERKSLPREMEIPGSIETEYPGKRHPSLPPIKSWDGMPSHRAPKLAESPIADQMGRATISDHFFNEQNR